MPAGRVGSARIPPAVALLPWAAARDTAWACRLAPACMPGDRGVRPRGSGRCPQFAATCGHQYPPVGAQEGWQLVLPLTVRNAATSRTIRARTIMAGR